MLTPDQLLPAELSILAAGMVLLQRGERRLYGLLVAKQVQDLEGGRLLSFGAMYRALHRMERAGLLESRWEEPGAAEREKRPRRRLYEITGVGVSVFERAMKHSPPVGPVWQPAPST